MGCVVAFGPMVSWGPGIIPDRVAELHWRSVGFDVTVRSWFRPMGDGRSVWVTFSWCVCCLGCVFVVTGLGAVDSPCTEFFCWMKVFGIMGCGLGVTVVLREIDIALVKPAGPGRLPLHKAAGPHPTSQRRPPPPRVREDSGFATFPVDDVHQARIA